MLYALLLRTCETEYDPATGRVKRSAADKRREIEKLCSWPIPEEDRRATWGEGPGVEAAQNAMMNL